MISLTDDQEFTPPGSQQGLVFIIQPRQQAWVSRRQSHVEHKKSPNHERIACDDARLASSASAAAMVISSPPGNNAAKYTAREGQGKTTISNESLMQALTPIHQKAQSNDQEEDSAATFNPASHASTRRIRQQVVAQDNNDDQGDNPLSACGEQAVRSALRRSFSRLATDPAWADRASEVKALPTGRCLPRRRSKDPEEGIAAAIVAPDGDNDECGGCRTPKRLVRPRKQPHRCPERSRHRSRFPAPSSAECAAWIV